MQTPGTREKHGILLWLRPSRITLYSTLYTHIYQSYRFSIPGTRLASVEVLLNIGARKKWRTDKHTHRGGYRVHLRLKMLHSFGKSESVC